MIIFVRIKILFGYFVIKFLSKHIGNSMMIKKILTIKDRNEFFFEIFD
jgi:hypothetical protein